MPGATDKRQEEAPAAVPVPPRATSHRRILVVDDLPAIHDDYRKILARHRPAAATLAVAESRLLGEYGAPASAGPFIVESALQGEQALESVERAVAAGTPYSLAFVDLRMPPGWDGVETVRRLWQADPALQVVICSAYADYTQEQLSASLGHHDQFLFLRKPFDPIEVLQLASALTEKWRLQRAERDAMARLEHHVGERTAQLLAANEALAREARRLQQSEDRMRATVDSALDCIVSMDASGTITAFNPAAERTFGFSREQVIGRSLADTIVPPGRRAAHREGLRRFLGGGEARLLGRRVEMTAVRADGSEILVELTITLVGSGPGTIFTGFLRDITDRRRGERDIARANRSLRMLGECNQAVIRSQTEPELLAQVCRIAVEVGGYSLAGVGYVEGEQPTRVRNVAVFGDNSGLIRKFAESECTFDDGPAGRAVRSGQPVVVADLELAEWDFASRAVLLERGYRSAISLPLHNAHGSFGVLGLCASEVFSAGESELQLLRTLAENLAFGIGSVRARTERERAERQRSRMEGELAASLARQQSLSRRLAEVRELEQQKLSSELHDRVGQDLTALSINLGIIDQLAPPALGPKLSARLEDSRRLLDRTIASVRDVIAELRPAALDHYGLLAGLRGYGEQVHARTGLAISVEGVEPLPRPAATVEAALFRVAQEALTNAVKHAHAHGVTVRLDCAVGLARLSITDDGTGFDVDRAERDWPRSSWGLQMMRERAEGVGARLEVSSLPGHGTRVVVEFPHEPEVP